MITTTLFVLIIAMGMISFAYSLNYTNNFGEELLSFLFHFAVEIFLMYLIGII